MIAALAGTAGMLGGEGFLVPRLHNTERELVETQRELEKTEDLLIRLFVDRIKEFSPPTEDLGLVNLVSIHGSEVGYYGEVPQTVLQERIDGLREFYGSESSIRTIKK